MALQEPMNFCPIVSLIHETNENNMVSMLKGGYILSGAEYEEQQRTQLTGGFAEGHWSEGGQFVGVYTGVVTYGMVDYPVRYFNKDGGIFELSDSLLTRDDYHINEFDNNGTLTNSSWTRRTIKPFLKKLDKLDRENIESVIQNMPEAVFHNKVPLKQLVSIWCTEANFYKLQFAFKRNGLERFIPMLQVTEYFPHVKCRDIFTVQPSGPARFCNTQTTNIDDSSVPKQINSLSTYSQIARNCGMDIQELKDFFNRECTGKTYKQCVDKLRDKIFNLEVKIISSKTYPPTVYYPPFDESNMGEILEEVVDSAYENLAPDYSESSISQYAAVLMAFASGIFLAKL